MNNFTRLLEAQTNKCQRPKCNKKAEYYDPKDKEVCKSHMNKGIKKGDNPKDYTKIPMTTGQEYTRGTDGSRR